MNRLAYSAPELLSLSTFWNLAGGCGGRGLEGCWELELVLSSLLLLNWVSLPLLCLGSPNRKCSPFGISPFRSTAKNCKCVPGPCSPLEKTKIIVSPNQAVLGENLTIFPLHPYLTLLSSLSPTLENTAWRRHGAGGDCSLFCFQATHLALSTVTWAPPEGQWSNWILHTSDPCTPSGWPPPATFWPVGGPRSQTWSYQQTLTRLTVGPAGEASSGVLSWAGAEVPFIPFPSLASFPSWRRRTGFTTPVGQLPLAPSWLIIGTLIRKPLRAPFHRDTQLLPGQWALGVQSPPWGSSPQHREVRGRHLGKLVPYSSFFLTSAKVFFWISVPLSVKWVYLPY